MGIDNKLSDAEMIKIIMDEIRHVRARLDDHIDDEKQSVSAVREDVSKIREELRGHKTMVGMIASGIAIIFTGIVNWFMGGVGR